MKKVLIADDDERIRTAMSIRLRDEGYEVVLSGDGDEAIEVARREKPNLVILDVVMPKANGLAVAEALRGEEDLERVPIIFMTGKDSPGYFDAAMELNGIAFLGKPFDSNTLLPLVSTALSFS